ncbi:hypothetical protein F4827_005048 [Paraburkholderia bannensis]|uniref:Uncharacterized protein n=1 Tax=Paraburkholderia bannensis TaxID=765414 RepID=A0A7W9U176_9BURK|nr:MULTISPECIES: hypothetical protein [Paraburkholderia]MBB3259976.1 hypothetical protein [Paraburkholderia sp. WP4_3_2]MBB6105182.1 hypothetical protein [Paraburkholderia bannensis]
MTANRQKLMPLWLIWIIAAITVVSFSAMQVALDAESAPPRHVRTA